MYVPLESADEFTPHVAAVVGAVPPAIPDAGAPRTSGFGVAEVTVSVVAVVRDPSVILA